MISYDKELCVKSLSYYNSDHMLGIMCSGLDPINSIKLKDLFKKTIDDYSYIVENDFIIDNNLLEIIFPCIRRVYSVIFMDDSKPIYMQEKIKKLEFIRLQFDLKEFLEYLSITLEKISHIFDYLTNLDSRTEMCMLITKNYTNSKFNHVMTEEEAHQKIRNLKIEKYLDI